MIASSAPDPLGDLNILSVSRNYFEVKSNMYIYAETLNLDLLSLYDRQFRLKYMKFFFET